MRWLSENVATALAYWLLSRIAFLVFQNMGVLPMPLWPAASLALWVAFYRGWRIAPGIAAGSVLANYYALHSPLSFALGIALMNTLGPELGAAIMRRRVTCRFVFAGPGDVLLCFFAAVIVVPILTATGGMACKWQLGLIAGTDLAVGWMKWALAHSLGTLLFAGPLFVWLALKESRTCPA